MAPFTPGIDDIDWEEIIYQMQGFFRSYFKDAPWFRGVGADTFLMGKTKDDYIYEAIGRYLENPAGYDPGKGTLIHYLEYNLLRSLVSNDLRKKENQTTRDVYGRILDHDADDDSTAYYDRLLPISEALFDDEIDYDTVMTEIESEVKKDTDCENIFLGLNVEGMKRADIIKEFGMTEGQYNNGWRRLKTILRDIALKYRIDKPAL